MSVDDGGPAFPKLGQSLRDWFASNERTYPPPAWLEYHFQTPNIESSGVMKHEALAKWRYEMADAMLAARKHSLSTEPKQDITDPRD